MWWTLDIVVLCKCLWWKETFKHAADKVSRMWNDLRTEAPILPQFPDDIVLEYLWPKVEHTFSDMWAADTST